MCAHIGGRWVISVWCAGVLPITGNGANGRATLPYCHFCVTVVKAPLCSVIGATAPPCREHISDVSHVAVITPPLCSGVGAITPLIENMLVMFSIVDVCLC